MSAKRVFDLLHERLAIKQTPVLGAAGTAACSRSVMPVDGPHAGRKRERPAGRGAPRTSA
jgi:hypothetical protein